MKRLSFRWQPWLLLAVCLGGLGAYLAFGLQREYLHIEMAEREHLAAQAKVIEVNLTRQLVAIDLTLQAIIAELPYWASQPDGQERAIRRLKSMEASMSTVRTFLVLDANGTVTLSNRAELVGRNFYQRDYFQAPLQSLNPKSLHVSAPFKTVLNVFSVTLSRTVLDSDGKFGGVVVASVDPVDIQILLNSVRYADDMRSMLVHGDGKVFVIEPPNPAVLGKDLSDPGSFLSQHLRSGRPESNFKGRAATTGEPRLPVLRTIQPPALSMDKPLVIVVSREIDALFAPWRRDARNMLLAYLSLVLLSSAGLWFYRRQRLQHRMNQQRLKLATEATGVGIWEFDLKSRRYHWDPAMFELFGLDAQSANARNDDWHQLLLPGELARIKAATRAVLRRSEMFNLTFQIRRQDGEVRFMGNRATLYRDEPGAPGRLIGTTEDVTERKLREVDLHIAAVAFNSHESMLITDPQTRIIRVNRAFTQQFGYSSEEAVGQTPRLLKSGEHDKAFYVAMWGDLRRDGAWQGEIWNRRKNGEVFPVWLTITAVRNADGALGHYVATHSDITERKAAEQEIRQLAFYDPLTQLANRRLLQDRLRQAMIQARRGQSRLALIYLDLDKFKPVNDEFGHPVGDQLLKAVAQRLLACVRESDTVARVGGDEFVLLLPEVEVAKDAIAIAEKLHAALKQPFDLPGGLRASISSSAGIAIYPEHGGDEATLTRHADEAMYQAKAVGRDRFVLFDAAG